MKCFKSHILQDHVRFGISRHGAKLITILSRLSFSKRICSMSIFGVLVDSQRRILKCPKAELDHKAWSGLYLRCLTVASDSSKFNNLVIRIVYIQLHLSEGFRVAVDFGLVFGWSFHVFTSLRQGHIFGTLRNLELGNISDFFEASNWAMEKLKKDWFFLVYRGWHPTHLYRDYNRPL